MSLWLGLLAASAQAAAPPAIPRQAVLAVEVVAEGAPVPEQRVDRRNPFAVQRVIRESGLVLDIDAAALAALRERLNVDAQRPFLLSEWVEVGPAPAYALRPLGLLFCSGRVRWGTFWSCLRDADGDGRLEGSVIYRNNVPDGGLQFQPIGPIPYHYLPADRTATGGTFQLGLGFGWDNVRDSTRLRFFAQVAGPGYRAEVDPSVEVDPASLPATIELAGAQLTVLSWDGRRPLVRVDRAFPARVVRLTSLGGATDDSVVLSILGGTGHHWRIEYPETVLPGAPR